MEINEIDKISGLSLSAGNYHRAVELVMERYENRQLLINTHIKMFVSLPTIKNYNDVVGLRILYGKIESSVQNLKTLNIKANIYRSLLR